MQAQRCIGVAFGLCGLMACSAGADPPHRSVSSGGQGTSSAGPTGTSAGTSGGGGPIGSGSGGSSVITLDSGSNGTDSGNFANCASDTRAAVPKQVDLFVMLDQSGSMTLEGNRWGPVTAALEAFVDDPASAGIGMAINYFPRGTDDVAKCDVNGYATPEVAMAPLGPAQSAAIKQSIHAHDFTTVEARDPGHSGTPTRPALAGAVQYMTSWIGAHPTHIGFVLLATDGQPSTGMCAPNHIADIAVVAQTATTSMPSIATYVVGIGDLANLNEIARAGGTGHDAFIVDGTGQTTQQEFLKAMNAIRTTSLPCDYAIPPSDAGTIDPKLVNVQYSPAGSGTPLVLPKATGSAPCAGTGWVYDDEAHPMRVVLCADTCAMVQQDRMAAIKIVFGCQTIVR